MPIPIILGGLAVLAGGYGVKKGIDAKNDMRSANSLNVSAQRNIQRAEMQADQFRKATSRTIQNLGKRKISILSGSIREFVKNFSKIKNIDFRESVGLDELKSLGIDNNWLGNLEKASIKATNLVEGGLGGAALGTVLAYGAFSAVSSGLGGLAVASTGTAIAGLSGAAATNATLAWLGGGALGTGATAFGMTGGMVVLGGLVAGPAIAIGGAFMASKANEAKQMAYANYDKSLLFADQCDAICAKLKAVGNRAGQIDALLVKLNGYMVKANSGLRDVISEFGSDYKSYPVEKRKIVGASAQLAKTMKIVLDTSLLSERGELTKESGKIMFIDREFMQSESRKCIEG